VTPGSEGLSVVSGLTFGPDGHLYVGSGNGVNRYDGRTGHFIDAFVAQGSGGLSLPVEVLFGPDRNLYVASANSGSVLRYDGRTGAFIDAFVPAGRGGINGPRQLLFKLTLRVCHPAGRHGHTRTITVGQLDAADHVRHGDRVGPCPRDGRGHEARG
jgi:hypothetical protein